MLIFLPLMQACGFFFIKNSELPFSAADLPFRDPDNTGSKITIGGFDLWYRFAGNMNSPDTLVVLHGGGGASSYYFFDTLEFLEKKYRVLYYDQRGSGRSQIKPDLNYYTVDKLTEELEDIRIELVNQDSIYLLAHSFGGVIALKYMIEYTGRVKDAVLVSPVPGKFSPTDGIFIPYVIVLKHGMPPRDPEKANEWHFRVQKTLFQNCFYDERNRALLNDPGFASFATMAALGKSFVGDNLLKNLESVGTRTLIIYGEVDFAPTGEEGQKKLNSALKNSTLIKFSQSGHFAFIEERELFSKTVSGFLDIP